MPQRHQGATQNHFSPLLGQVSEMSFGFGEINNSMEVSREKGEVQDGSEHFMLQWKHTKVNPSGFSQGEEESGLLECSPLSKWDPKEHKELEVIQEIVEGEAWGSKVKNLKWVCSLMKSFCRIVGFPIVKHEDQCLALFHLLEQDCFDVVNVGTSKDIVSSRQKGLRELKCLISSVNYDGLASKGRNRDSSIGMGVITGVR